AERDMSLLKLSALSDISYSTFKMTERRGGQLSVDTIERICRALGISMAQFFAVWEGERRCDKE
ncbi:MAG: helix-turn-helix transcriptional regulator, partial [Oscillospiraceae bacterium]|nr:helix-turn-helix transcriptional regulator [Oscillospiraceae bacterium]